ncbi:MAG: luciferase family protein [Chloroflexota bacterium]
MKIFFLVIVVVAVGACSGAPPQTVEQTTSPPNSADVETDVVEQEVIMEPTQTKTADNQSASIVENEEAVDIILSSLPERAGPRTLTTGTVPHVQIGVDPVPAVNDELYRRTFALPGVEDRPTIVSLPGARGMWLSEDIALAHPEAIVNGREFAHIHPDGSLHAPLPYERALEVAEKGWGERHPWADQRDGWDGFVMLYTPQSMDELDITFQLIVESYNHVTGRTVQAAEFK